MAMAGKQYRILPARLNVNSNNSNKGHKAMPTSALLPSKANPSSSSTSKKIGSSSNSYAENHTRSPPPYTPPNYLKIGSSPRQRRKETNRSTLKKSQSSDTIHHMHSQVQTSTKASRSRVPESVGSQTTTSRSRERNNESYRSQSTDRNHRPVSPGVTLGQSDNYFCKEDQRHSRSREQSGSPQLKRSHSFTSYKLPPARETSQTTCTSQHTTQTELFRTAQSRTGQLSFPVAIESNHQTQSNFTPTTSRTHRSTSPVTSGSGNDLVGVSKSTETQRLLTNSRHKFEQKTTPTTHYISTTPSSIRRDEPSTTSTVVFLEAKDRSVTSKDISLPESGGLVGLTNLGNTCFMNSMLQCLGQTVEMVSIFKNMKNGSTNQPLVKAYRELMQQIWSVNESSNRHTTKSLYPRALKDVFSQKNPQFSGFSQHDSQEFMRFLVSSLHEELKKPHKPKPDVPQKQDPRLWWDWYRKLETSDLLDVFVGQLCSCLKCKTCKNESLTFDPFWELSVSLPKRSSTYLTTHSLSYGSSPASAVQLYDCLDIFTREENLNGDEMPYCDNCKSLQPSVKKLTIQRLPPILVIHLKRFSGYGLRSKLDTPINIPHTLNVSNYISKSDISGTEYELYAVSNHSGTVYFGHYTAWCKHYLTNKWYSYNDGHVSTLTVQSPTFSSSTAYVLFYRQKIKISKI